MQKGLQAIRVIQALISPANTPHHLAITYNLYKIIITKEDADKEISLAS
jgi:hypothetical protein